MVAEQQRAQLDPAALGRGVAADHEFLVAHAFELEPMRRPAAVVFGVGQLGDHALVAALARRPVGRDAVLHPVGGEAQRILKLDCLAQQPFTPQQWHVGGRFAVEMQQVEDVVEHPDRRRPGHIGVGDAQPALQPREARAAPLEGHHLTVEDEPRGVLGGERVDDLGVGPVERQAISRQQPHPVAVAERQAAHAVEFALEDPVGIGKPLVGQRGQRGGAPIGHRLVAQRGAHRTRQAGQARHGNPHSSSCVSPSGSCSRRASASPLRLISSHVSSGPSHTRVSE